MPPRARFRPERRRRDPPPSPPGRAPRSALRALSDRRRGFGVLAAALLAAGLLAGLPGRAAAHVTPPLVLLSERDAVAALAGDIEYLAVRGVRLTPGQAETIQDATGWTPESAQRFYVCRSGEGALRRAILFLTEYTVHGMLRVAVALAPDGRVAAARIVEIAEESFSWVEPLVKQGFTTTLEGKRAGDTFAPTGRFSADHLPSMQHFYAEQTAELVHRATVLFDIAFDRDPPAPSASGDASEPSARTPE